MVLLVKIQEEYAETIKSGMLRWAHRKDGGHMARIRRGARKRAYAKLHKLGFADHVISVLIQDAHDVAILELNAE